MNDPQFSTFQYQHTDPVSRSYLRWALTLGCFAISGLAFFGASRSMGDGFIPVGIIAIVVGLVAYGSVSRFIMLGPRYLLCGTTIVYYGHVTHIYFYRETGTLRLAMSDGGNFILERDKFPTGARHEPKITKNKTEKFEKVSNKIIEKIENVRPNVKKTGC